MRFRDRSKITSFSQSMLEVCPISKKTTKLWQTLNSIIGRNSPQETFLSKTWNALPICLRKGTCELPQAEIIFRSTPPVIFPPRRASKRQICLHKDKSDNFPNQICPFSSNSWCSRTKTDLGSVRATWIMCSRRYFRHAMSASQACLRGSHCPSQIISCLSIHHDHNQPWWTSRSRKRLAVSA